MSDLLYYIIAGVLTLGVLAGIAMMSRVERSSKGNRLSAVCMALAVLVTVYRYQLISDAGLWIAMALGAALSLMGARRVKMIEMPQAVALLNGFGGVASAIVGAMELANPSVISGFSTATAGLAVLVGTLTLTGSLVAAFKLQGLMKQQPHIWPAHTAITILSLAVSALPVVLMTIGLPVGWTTALCFMASGLFGVAFAARVGGADMPITISLLNSFSGVAAGIAGLAIADPLLVAIGGIVGASGLLLTQIMCRAMNRSLMDILLGKTTVLTHHTNAVPWDVSHKYGIPAEDGADGEALIGSEEPETNLSELMREAKRIIIVPGYGMALAQAQGLVKNIADKFEADGKEVKYAIHPVAGRMPGHMNILLAEVDVPYDQLYEMDDINPEFERCDVAIVIGANDVVNPAANTAEGTPIYGMPILHVEKAKHLILCNYDTKPGYSGVDNPLYLKSHKITLLLGDAKDTLAGLLAEL
ncbi:MAG: NAD(P)(+) transhydrogenase (Re/Si-specific) subunit beta [Clostridia bacterium]|nr:NAD(P)(+) transhydrogenase (Re/Si-specific) subunit beta [Clostridia bacterium]